MPTNRQKRTRSRAGLDYWKLAHLIEGNGDLIAGPGFGYFPEGATGGCNYWTDDQWADWESQIRADWQAHGADVLAWWRGDTEQFTAVYASIGGKQRDASVTPWALTEFGEPA